MATSPAPDHRDASSTGQANTAAAWLDAHFAASRAEYARALDLVGLRPGWRVLDAGCGAGSFLPLIAARVGPTGRVAGLDLAPENVALARARLAATPPPCPAAVRQGSLFALPYPDGAFDAVWLANVLMYLTPAEWGRALAECRRVVRPGGLVACQEADQRLTTFWPVPCAHLAPVATLVWPAQFAGWLDTRGLPFAFARAGLAVVRRATVVLERWAPLAPASRLFLGRVLALLGRQGSDPATPFPPAARAFWAAPPDPDDPVRSSTTRSSPTRAPSSSSSARSRPERVTPRGGCGADLTR
jgi:ubiquinone/menaquinone biosynthesis C-methylase UbiE